MTPKFIFAGIVVFTVTRPIQVLWVGAAVFGSWNDANNVKWQGVLQFVLTVLFTGMQLWSTTINVSIWKRSRARLGADDSEVGSASHHVAKTDSEDLLEDSMPTKSPPSKIPSSNPPQSAITSSPRPQLGHAESMYIWGSQEETKCEDKSGTSFARLRTGAALISLLAVIASFVLVPSSDDVGGTFLDYATKELDEIHHSVCRSIMFESVCKKAEELEVMGLKYSSLAPHYQANYRAMTLAYPLSSNLVSEKNDGSPSEKLLLAHYFFRVLRIHRSLGLCNSLRLQGHSEHTVNVGCWNHYELLEAQDSDMPPRRDGINEYCRFKAKEYQSLLDYANENIESFSLLEDSAFITGETIDSPMFKLCASKD